MIDETYQKALHKLSYYTAMLWCLLWKIKDGKIVEVVNFAADQHEADRFFYKAYQLKPVQERMT
ncbi:hypothetical protein ACTJJB_04175 [Chitinophaga sp. 22536]|uniref:hypothetical protein n=1 Tax=unclassified Chitinophaga TaxID=2619133 RepID=UPI003F84A638